MQALADRQILSAPVMTGRKNERDSTVDIKHHADGDVLGFLDVRDILLHFLRELGAVQRLIDMPMLQRMQHLEASGATFCKKLVSDVSNYGSDGNFLHSGRVRDLFTDVPTVTCYI
jgi:hypothetical protein